MLAGPGAGASAEDYPTRQVKIIIAFSPSGAIDILGRFIADKLGQLWGQSVIVENRPGGSGNIERGGEAKDIDQHDNADVFTERQKTRGAPTQPNIETRLGGPGRRPAAHVAGCVSTFSPQKQANGLSL